MYPAIVFLPLAGALLAGFFGRSLGDKMSGFLTSLFLVIAAGLSWVAFYHVGFLGEEARVPIMPFIQHRGSADYMVAAHRYAHGRHAGRGDNRLGSRPHLFHRLYVRRRPSAALLCGAVAIHLRHAIARHSG